MSMRVNKELLEQAKNNANSIKMASHKSNHTCNCKNCHCKSESRENK